MPNCLLGTPLHAAEILPSRISRESHLKRPKKESCVGMIHRLQCLTHAIPLLILICRRIAGCSQERYRTVRSRIGQNAASTLVNCESFRLLSLMCTVRPGSATAASAKTLRPERRRLIGASRWSRRRLNARDCAFAHGAFAPGAHLDRN
jgi:hypothetical protein